MWLRFIQTPGGELQARLSDGALVRVHRASDFVPTRPGVYHVEDLDGHYTRYARLTRCHRRARFRRSEAFGPTWEGRTYAFRHRYPAGMRRFRPAILPFCFCVEVERLHYNGIQYIVQEAARKTFEWYYFTHGGRDWDLHGEWRCESRDVPLADAAFWTLREMEEEARSGYDLTLAYLMGRRAAPIFENDRNNRRTTTLVDMTRRWAAGLEAGESGPEDTHSHVTARSPGVKTSVLHRRVVWLGLTPWVQRRLLDAGVHHVGELVWMSTWQLQEIKGIGCGAVGEIRRVLNDLGLDLGIRLASCSSQDLDDAGAEEAFFTQQGLNPYLSVEELGLPKTIVNQLHYHGVRTIMRLLDSVLFCHALNRYVPNGDLVDNRALELMAQGVNRAGLRVLRKPSRVCPLMGIPVSDWFLLNPGDGWALRRAEFATVVVTLLAHGLTLRTLQCELDDHALCPLCNRYRRSWTSSPPQEVKATEALEDFTSPMAGPTPRHVPLRVLVLGGIRAMASAPWGLDEFFSAGKWHPDDRSRLTGQAWLGLARGICLDAIPEYALEDQVLVLQELRYQIEALAHRWSPAQEAAAGRRWNHLRHGVVLFVGQLFSSSNLRVFRSSGALPFAVDVLYALLDRGYLEHLQPGDPDTLMSGISQNTIEEILLMAGEAGWNRPFYRLVRRLRQAYQEAHAEGASGQQDFGQLEAFLVAFARRYLDDAARLDRARSVADDAIADNLSNFRYLRSYQLLSGYLGNDGEQKIGVKFPATVRFYNDFLHHSRYAEEKTFYERAGHFSSFRAAMYWVLVRDPFRSQEKDRFIAEQFCRFRDRGTAQDMDELVEYLRVVSFQYKRWADVRQICPICTGDDPRRPFGGDDLGYHLKTWYAWDGGMFDDLVETVWWRKKKVDGYWKMDTAGRVAYLEQQMSDRSSYGWLPITIYLREMEEAMGRRNETPMERWPPNVNPMPRILEVLRNETRLPHNIHPRGEEVEHPDLARLDGHRLLGDWVGEVHGALNRIYTTLGYEHKRSIHDFANWVDRYYLIETEEMNHRIVEDLHPHHTKQGADLEHCLSLLSDRMSSGTAHAQIVQRWLSDD